MSINVTFRGQNAVIKVMRCFTRRGVLSHLSLGTKARKILRKTVKCQLVDMKITMLSHRTFPVLRTCFVTRTGFRETPEGERFVAVPPYAQASTFHAYARVMLLEAANNDTRVVKHLGVKASISDK